MFPRVTTIRQGSKTYQYVQIVESYREDGKNKKRVCATWAASICCAKISEAWRAGGE